MDIAIQFHNLIDYKKFTPKSSKDLNLVFYMFNL